MVVAKTLLKSGFLLILMLLKSGFHCIWPKLQNISWLLLPPTQNLSRIGEIRSIKKGSTCSFTEFFAKLLVVKDTNFAHFSQILPKSVRVSEKIGANLSLMVHKMLAPLES